MIGREIWRGLQSFDLIESLEQQIDSLRLKHRQSGERVFRGKGGWKYTEADCDANVKPRNRRVQLYSILATGKQLVRATK